MIIGIPDAVLLCFFFASYTDLHGVKSNEYTAKRTSMPTSEIPKL